MSSVPLPPASVGILLRTSDPFGEGLVSPSVAAATCEDHGVRALWVGDHLSFRVPWLDARLSLAVAATATRHALVGHDVLLTALRPGAWIAKHVTTMQLLAPDRFVLGVGVGGESPEEWAAVAVPTRERGRRTDELLAALPALLAGRAVRLACEQAEIPPLLPRGPVPPVVVGGRSDAAYRRAVRHGDAWIGAFLDRAGLRRSIDRLGELAGEAGRRPPSAGLTVTVAIGPDRRAALEQARLFVERAYDVDWHRMQRYVVAGEAAEVADALMALRAAGAAHLVLQGTAPDALREYEVLAEAARTVAAAS
jgi:alkanesulfonate monooxygenase SsuD/methylene tetrahydromethanopterin reductase-like flavin-dependent oxidoreductase (luciferase family)